MAQFTISSNVDARTYSAATGIDWSGLAQLGRVDPYLVWMDLTSTKLSSATGSVGVNVLVELAPGPTTVVEFVDALTKYGELEATHFHSVLPVCHRFISIRVAMDGLVWLAQECSKTNGLVKRFELMSERNGQRGFDISTYWGYVKTINEKLASTVSAANKKKMSLPPGAPSGLVQISSTGVVAAANKCLAPLLGVIDDGCNFAAHMIKRGPATLLVSLWHQDEDDDEFPRRKEAVAPGNDSPQLSDQAIWDRGYPTQQITINFPPPVFPITIELPRGSLFGLRLRLENLQRLGLSVLAEPELYRQISYEHPLMAWTHGAAMLGVLMQPVRSAPPQSTPPNSAPEVSFVQLPLRTVEDTAGGSLSARALDGIHDLLDQAAGKNISDQTRPVVVNLSYGTHAGPHDGSSMFECALVELLNRNPQLHVVLPAGNSHVARCHASGWLTSGCRTRTLRWMVQPDDRSDSFMEIWFHDAAIRPEIVLRSPRGDLLTAKAGQAKVMADQQPVGTVTATGASGGTPDATIEAAIIYPTAVAQGTSGTMILVALAPTRRGLTPGRSSINGAERARMSAAHGVWEVTLSQPDGQPVRFDAWIQRDDSSPGGRRARRGALGRQTYFLDDAAPDGTVVGAEPRCTMNGIATVSHDRLWVVGAMRANDGSMSHYSASGPNACEPSRFDGPDAVMVADQSRNSPGITTTGMLGASRMRLSGTSLAAARLSRQLCEHLAGGGTAASFVSPWPQPDAAPDRVCAGAPVQAPPLHRGDIGRVQEVRTALDRCAAPAVNLPADKHIPPDRC